MSVVCLIVEDEPVRAITMQHARQISAFKTLTIDRPKVEAARASVDLAEHERNGFIGFLRRPAVSKDGVVPQRFRRRGPNGRPALVGVLHNDAHAGGSVVVFGSA